MNSLHFRLLVDVEADGMQQQIVFRHGDGLAAGGVLQRGLAALVLSVDVGRRVVMLETTPVAPTDLG